MTVTQAINELLAPLESARRRHSIAVGAKAAAAAHLIDADLRSEVETAAALHDVGYAHPVLGFHPLDGARFLAGQGFSKTVCHLVAHHTASTYEAAARGIELSEYHQFDPGRDDLGPAHAVVWWADLTTGPQGHRNGRAPVGRDRGPLPGSACGRTEREGDLADPARSWPVARRVGHRT